LRFDLGQFSCEFLRNRPAVAIPGDDRFAALRRALARAGTLGQFGRLRGGEISRSRELMDVIQVLRLILRIKNPQANAGRRC
jgi:hypothetical protein